MSPLTHAQQRAVQADGNLLVLAGAGTGKTKTLVERCIARLLDPKNPANIDEFLMATFTEAAAAEMKARIREALAAANLQAPDARLEEQLALLATADIGTLHSFCLKLVRQHFHHLDLDPQLGVLDESAARLMMDETLDSLLEGVLERPAVRELAETQGGEYWLRRLLLRLHDYTQTLADPQAWFAAQRSASPEQWDQWLLQGFDDFKAYWLPVLQAQPPRNDRAHLWAAHLQRFPRARSRAGISACLTPIVDLQWPSGMKQFRKVINGFYDGAEFLHSLCGCARESAADPLQEDWQWTRGHMDTLLDLAQEFSRVYAARKRDEAMLDFHDFEQFTLRLLRKEVVRGVPAEPSNAESGSAGTPRPTRFKHVFVDECQDINAAQDAILRGVSNGNLFLVGDVKQSIYRFRLADPRIFQDYKAKWEKEGRVVPLADNFRSRAALLDFINPLFSDLMQFGIGSIVYDADAMLKCAGEWPALPDEPAVEAHFLLAAAEREVERREGERPREPSADEDPDSLIAELTRAEQEAALVARRLRELKELPLMVCENGAMRPAEWKDFALLMRSPANKAETYAKEFARQQIPLQAEQGDFFECAEISDLLSLLQVLDNPLQDVPLLAVLRSPMVGLTLDELADIRMANPPGQFWKALARWHEIHPESESKVSVFLKRFSRFRQIARETSLSQRLEVILNETSYLDWVRTQSRPEQRLANVRRFLTFAQQFDPLQRHGLKRFLRFIEGRREADVNSEPIATTDANAVQLMSIHKSKGLEFPVVVLADLAKPFNFSDLAGRVLLDEVYGLCPQVKPPRANAIYPSLPHWLASQRQRRESIGEELRLLYVAMTRAKDRLILTSTMPSNAAQKWPTTILTAHKLISARGYIDWLGPWLAARAGEPAWLDQPRGKCKLFEWFTHPAPPACAELPLKTDHPAGRPREPAGETTADSWTYPHVAATREIATQRVTSLRERLAEDDIATPRAPIPRPTKTKIDISPLQFGNAHHQFLQLMSLDGPWTEAALRQQAAAMHNAGYLVDCENLDYAALRNFWQYDFGQRILAQRKFLHREIPFTARMSPADLKADGLAPNEFIIVRGAVDLAVILPDEIWVVDFKTDALSDGDLTEALRLYTPQLQLYGRALERIYRRPAHLYLHFLALNDTVSIA